MSSDPHADLFQKQQKLNADLIKATPFVGKEFTSKVLPFTLDPTSGELTAEQETILTALEKKAATIAIKALGSLARAGDLDHLGGGLELIPALMLTMLMTDYEKRHYTIEHAHTTIGYYSSLAALGFLDEQHVIDGFRRSLDIGGHVSWVPGGSELNGGRLGVMIPAAVGQALGVRARKGKGSAVVVHMGDAGWVSGQALNGFIGASLHNAPLIGVMHRNGIQLSNTTDNINPKDPREIIASTGVKILEIPSLHDHKALMKAYAEATKLADQGQPTLIYPVGYRSEKGNKVTLKTLAEKYNIVEPTEAFAAKNNVDMDTEIWIPGSLMSFRDETAMLECVFLVNNLPGGHGHHDGGMQGRDEAAVLAGSMLQLTAEEEAALEKLKSQSPRVVVTTARPAKGTPNLVLSREDRASMELPGTDKEISARAGIEQAYILLAQKFGNDSFFVSCDLNTSTKLGKGAALLPEGHSIEMSIQEQASLIMANGLAVSSRQPQLNVMSTFAGFIEGIAREGLEMWRYNRNLTGPNEGLNVLVHMSHVGANFGRDHFPGWSLDWVTMCIGYLPFINRFYTPADARAAYIAVCDAPKEYGGHIVCIPRDLLPVLTKQDSEEPFWEAGDDWQATQLFRKFDGAETVVLSMGAPTFVAGQAAEAAAAQGVPTDVYVINGMPLPADFLADIAKRYKRVITIEDGLIGNPDSGLRGFAAYVSSRLADSDVKMRHFGITDPSTAPANYYTVVWEHFQMTKEVVLDAVLALNQSSK